MRCPEPLDFRLEVHEVLSSTSSYVREAAEAGAAEGLSVLALRQSQGRGRQGREWQSPAGNMYLSVLLRPSISIAEAAHWSFVSALAVADAIRSYLPDPSLLSLKWPNDVLLAGAKVAGILLETGVSARRELDWICVGIGVNIATAPNLPERPTACVAQYIANPPTVQAFTEVLLGQLGFWHSCRLREGFAPIRAAWLASGPALGTPMTHRHHGGLWTGEFAGLSPEGALMLASHGQVKNIVSGEIE